MLASLWKIIKIKKPSRVFAKHETLLLFPSFLAFEMENYTEKMKIQKVFFLYFKKENQKDDEGILKSHFYFYFWREKCWWLKKQKTNPRLFRAFSSRTLYLSDWFFGSFVCQGKYTKAKNKNGKLKVLSLYYQTSYYQTSAIKKLKSMAWRKPKLVGEEVFLSAILSSLLHFCTFFLSPAKWKVFLFFLDGNFFSLFFN